MRRQYASSPPPIEELIEVVRKKYGQTPLAAVGEKLIEPLAFIRNAGIRDESTTAGCRAFVELTMQKLPESFGARFLFDAAVIQSICEEWSAGGKLRLSKMIVPRYRGEGWGYQVVPMQPEDTRSTHVVKVVDFPGEDRPDEINILEYPFLLHELGHDLIYRPDCSFRARFSRELKALLDRWRLRAIPDRAGARFRAIQVIDQTASFWMPTPDQHDWAHEVGVDMIALWSVGPAYLDAFCTVLGTSTIKPYELMQDYPPYAVRAMALVAGAERLGWGEKAHGLRSILQDWEQKEGGPGRNNTFATGAAPEISSACIESALASCKDLGLPLCNQVRLDLADQMVREGRVPDYGINLILGAWIAAAGQLDSAESAWEIHALASLIG